MVGVRGQPIGNVVTMASDHRRVDGELVQGALLDDTDFLKEIVERVVQELWEAEMTEHIGAAPYERSVIHAGQRNGHKPRTLRTGVCTLNLLMPLLTARAPSLRASSPVTNSTRTAVPGVATFRYLLCSGFER
jgi:hypothetical protein